jgi:uncharacterized protein (TIGR02145 family)
MVQQLDAWQIKMMKFLITILFLFFFEFANAQVPGTLGFSYKSPRAQSFTLSVSSLNFTSANVTARILNNGVKPVTTSGILWGFSVPTISSYTGITTNGNIAGNEYTNTMTGLAIGGTYYIVAYATNIAGTSYGNVLTYTHGTVYNGFTGKTWLAVNLGATAFPTSISDSAGYGTLYQWGRLSDGHQYVRPTASSSTSSLSGSDVPNNGLFIVPGSSPYDWRSGQNANLWQGVNGINNPCPIGFRLPTKQEFTDEKNSWNASDANYGAFSSVLKLTYCGRRYWSNTQPQQYVGDRGYYWTSDIEGSQNSYFFRIMKTQAPDFPGDGRGSALAVRCIKD